MLILYYSPGACSIAPHIALEESGLPFEARRVSITEGEHRTAQYVAINPRGRVPALVVDGEAVTEAPALLAYIASLRPERALMPAPGTLDFARCLEVMAFLSSSLHIAYAQYWRPERFLPEDFRDKDAFIAAGHAGIRRLNSEVEVRWLRGPWVLGDRFSIADAYLFPFYRWGVRVGLPMAGEHPRWTDWLGRMLERAAVRRVVDREGIGLDWVPPMAPAIA